MADNQQPVTGNEPVGATPAVTEGNNASVTLESLQAELASATKRIAELNKESEKHRKEADAIKAAKQAEDDAKKSETEKLADKITALQREKEDAIQKANARIIKAEILAKSARFIDADAVLALVDKSKIEVKEDGAVEGVDALLDELAKAKPHLLKPAQKPGATLGATNPGGAATSETPQQKYQRIFGSNTNPFDQSFVLKQGGGVVNNEE